MKTASQEDYLRLVEEKFRPIKKKLEEEVIASGMFEPKVVYGYFPAQSEGNDVIVYDLRERQPRTQCPERTCRALPFRASARAASFPSATFSRPKARGKWM